jgi:hypothetical protein
MTKGPAVFVMSGQGQGYDIELVQLVSEAVTIPVIASSGAGQLEHFSEVFHKTAASAALAAGIFHREEVTSSFTLEELKCLVYSFLCIHSVISMLRADFNHISERAHGASRCRHKTFVASHVN